MEDGNMVAPSTASAQNAPSGPRSCAQGYRVRQANHQQQRFDEAQLKEQRLPTASELDQVAPMNPVVLIRGGHEYILN
jgi:predicted amidohydrolase YtcJ